MLRYLTYDDWIDWQQRLIRLCGYDPQTQEIRSATGSWVVADLASWEAVCVWELRLARDSLSRDMTMSETNISFRIITAETPPSTTDTAAHDPADPTNPGDSTDGSPEETGVINDDDEDEDEDEELPPALPKRRRRETAKATSFPDGDEGVVPDRDKGTNFRLIDLSTPSPTRAPLATWKRTTPSLTCYRRPTATTTMAMAPKTSTTISRSPIRQSSFSPTNSGVSRWMLGSGATSAASLCSRKTAWTVQTQINRSLSGA